LVAAKAATQGIYRIENAKNAYAERGVKIPCSASAR
jgi:hypothetical protein